MMVSKYNKVHVATLHLCTCICFSYAAALCTSTRVCTLKLVRWLLAQVKNISGLPFQLSELFTYPNDNDFGDGQRGSRLDCTIIQSTLGNVLRSMSSDDNYLFYLTRANMSAYNFQICACPVANNDIMASLMRERISMRQGMRNWSSTNSGLITVKCWLITQ